MATRDLTRRFAELRVLQHGVDGGGSEAKRPGDAFSESGLLDVRGKLLLFCCPEAGNSKCSSSNIQPLILIKR